MDDIAWRALGQSPNLALLATSEGRVVLRQGWVDPVALAPEIDKLIAEETIRRREEERRLERPQPSDQLQEIMKRLEPKYPTHGHSCGGWKPSTCRIFDCFLTSTQK